MLVSRVKAASGVHACRCRGSADDPARARRASPGGRVRGRRRRGRGDGRSRARRRGDRGIRARRTEPRCPSRRRGPRSSRCRRRPLAACRAGRRRRPAALHEEIEVTLPADKDDPLADIRDDVDVQVLPIFLDEAAELFPQAGEELRAWRRAPADDSVVASLRRTLHTFKGSARMAGAMRLGELAHLMESRLSEEGAVARDAAALRSARRGPRSDRVRARRPAP